MLGVQVKLTDNEILELFWRPPGVLYGFKKRSSTECNLFRHFVNAWLTGHAKRHVKVHRVPDHKLVRCRGPLTKDLRQSVVVLIQRQYINEVKSTDHGRSRVSLWEWWPVLANYRIMLSVCLLKGRDLIGRRLLCSGMYPKRSSIL